MVNDNDTTIDLIDIDSNIDDKKEEAVEQWCIYISVAPLYLIFLSPTSLYICIDTRRGKKGKWVICINVALKLSYDCFVQRCGEIKKEMVGDKEGEVMSKLGELVSMQTTHMP